ncbi:MAG: T9SS type A sorting domain-containing protein [Bacteroidetes bacterium]|nr:T9SS type A sorting domain-containing protein [Bacteroidota bacterium]
MLLSKSPYLSTEVLMQMDEKGILPDAMVAEICIANPEATSKDGFTDWLEFKAPHPLPSYMIDQIIASWDSKTYRFTLERDMASHHQDMTQAAVLWLDRFQSDSSYTPMDSLRMVWRQVRTSAARYAEALTFIEEGRYDSARIVVEMIPVEDPKLKEKQLEEKDRMLQLVDFFRDMAAAGKSAAQLGHDDITRLEGIIDGQYDRPATWAQNLLCFHYKRCRPPLTGGEDRPAPRMVRAYTADGTAKALPALVIRPNPANTWVVFEYRILKAVDNAYIRVVGIDGRELPRIPITAPEGQPVYDTRNMAKGAYTVELVNAGKTVETGKLMVE